jgi:hypothetical protein
MTFAGMSFQVEPIRFYTFRKSKRNTIGMVSGNQNTIAEQISELEKELAALDVKREELKNKIVQLQNSHNTDTKIADPIVAYGNFQVTGESSEIEKISLFRSLFRGREDVYPKRFENKRTGKSGYQPVCNNEWIRPICQKLKIKCGECKNRDFQPTTDDVIRNHLIGKDPKDRYQRDFVIGVYPMFTDETCWFLAVDFDKDSWVEDAGAYLATCTKFKVPAYLERSRSGNGGHV